MCNAGCNLDEREAGTGRPKSIQRMGDRMAASVRSSVKGATLSFAAAIKAVVVAIASSCAIGGDLQKGGHVRTLVDFGRLCFRVEAVGFAADLSDVSQFPEFEALVQFSVVCVVQRSRNSLETVESVWSEGKLLRRGPSSFPMHNYGTWVVVKEVMSNVPVRRTMMQKVSKNQHLHSLRVEMLPVVLSLRLSGLSFEVADWLNGNQAKKVFAVRRQNSVEQVFERVMGSRSGALGVSRQRAGKVGASLYFCKDLQVISRTQMQLLYVNGELAGCDPVEQRVRVQAFQYMQSLGCDTHRRVLQFPFILFLDCPTSSYTCVAQEGGKQVAFSGTNRQQVVSVVDGVVGGVFAAMHKAWRGPPSRASRALSRTQRDSDAPLFSELKGRGSRIQLPCLSMHACSHCHLAIGSMLHSPPFRLAAEDAKQQQQEAQHPRREVSIAKAEGLQSSVESRLVPTEVSRRMLQNGRCVGQIDKKFIAMTCGSVLVLFDQHAADERVRLEHLSERLTEDLGKGLCSRAVFPPLLVDANMQEVHAVEEYQSRLKAWGWSASPSSSATADCTGRIEISGVPCVDGRVLSAGDLMDYLGQLNATHGANAMPKAMTSALASRACRSAIKFGDDLSLSECEALIERLKGTRMCFHCAHGRPTCIPLVDASKLTCIQAALNLNPRSGSHKKRKIDVPNLRRVAAQGLL